MIDYLWKEPKVLNNWNNTVCNFENTRKSTQIWVLAAKNFRTEMRFTFESLWLRIESKGKMDGGLAEVKLTIAAILSLCYVVQMSLAFKFCWVRLILKFENRVVLIPKYRVSLIKCCGQWHNWSLSFVFGVGAWVTQATWFMD